MALFVDLVALSNGLHGSVQMDSVALFSWIGWLRHHGILKNHRCVVLPCTSNIEKFENAYHPVYNKHGNKSFYRLYVKNGGLEKNTAVDITQIRTISFGRIKKNLI